METYRGFSTLEFEPCMVDGKPGMRRVPKKEVIRRIDEALARHHRQAISARQIEALIRAGAQGGEITQAENGTYQLKGARWPAPWWQFWKWGR